VTSCECCLGVELFYYGLDVPPLAQPLDGTDRAPARPVDAHVARGGPPSSRRPEALRPREKFGWQQRQLHRRGARIRGTPRSCGLSRSAVSRARLGSRRRCYRLVVRRALPTRLPSHLHGPFGCAPAHPTCEPASTRCGGVRFVPERNQRRAARAPGEKASAARRRPYSIRPRPHTAPWSGWPSACSSREPGSSNEAVHVPPIVPRPVTPSPAPTAPRRDFSSRRRSTGG